MSAGDGSPRICAPDPGKTSPEPDLRDRYGLRIGYADPPYPGQSRKHYGNHPDYAGEVDHLALCNQLADFDGWVLHTSSVALPMVLDCVRQAELTDWRIMSWVKPFAAFKRGVPVAYAWEPVIVKPARKPVVSGRMVMRDWLAESITMRRGLSGAKPERLCHWLFDCVGAGVEDSLVDLFPGTCAVTRAWETWSQQLREVAGIDYHQQPLLNSDRCRGLGEAATETELAQGQNKP